jgi:hypothetical protein
VANSGVYVGKMASHIPEFQEGEWYRWGNNVFGTSVTPGKQTTVILESDAPPTTVGCKVHGGPMKIQGIDEEMPLILENALAGYKNWPHGHTIGPSDRLQEMPPESRASEIKRSLKLFVDSGWMSPSLLPRYADALTGKLDRQKIREMVRRDIESNNITTEIHALLSTVTEKGP